MKGGDALTNQELLGKIGDEIIAFREEATKGLEKENKSALLRSRKTTLVLDKLFKQWRRQTVNRVET